MATKAVLKVIGWIKGSLAYGSEETETNFVDYALTAGVNGSASATIEIADPDGTRMQKYFSDSTMFIGQGKVTIEHPAATDVFIGRIQSGWYDSVQQRLILECEDWSCQFKDQRIKYDMGEDLDGAGLRISYAQADPDSGVFVGASYTTGANYYLYDDDMSHVANEWDDYYIAFLAEMAGTKVITVGPYAEAVTSSGDGLETDNFTNDIEDLWTDDANRHLLIDSANVDDWYVVYDFRTIAPYGSLYNSGPDAIQLNITYHCYQGRFAVWNVYVYDHNAPAWVHIKTLDPGEGGIVRTTINIPKEYIAKGYAIDSDTCAHIKIQCVDPSAAGTAFSLFHLTLSTTLVMDGTLALPQIITTAANNYKVDTNLFALGIYEGCPYKVIRKIKNRINEIVTDNDRVEVMTTSVDATDGFSTAQFLEKTAYEILDQLAVSDGAHWFVTLGTKELTWDDVSVAPASAGTLTDASIIGWNAEIDIKRCFSRWHIYGRNEVYWDTHDSVPFPGNACESETNIVRSNMKKLQSVSSDYEAQVLGDYLTYKTEKNRYPIITAILSGFSAYRIGHGVMVTSTAMNINALHYCTHFNYDSKLDMTTLILQRQNPYGYHDDVDLGAALRGMIESKDFHESEKNIVGGNMDGERVID